MKAPKPLDIAIFSIRGPFEDQEFESTSLQRQVSCEPATDEYDRPITACRQALLAAPYGSWEPRAQDAGNSKALVFFVCDLLLP